MYTYILDVGMYLFSAVVHGRHEPAAGAESRIGVEKRRWRHRQCGERQVERPMHPWALSGSWIVEMQPNKLASLDRRRDGRRLP